MPAEDTTGEGCSRFNITFDASVHGRGRVELNGIAMKCPNCGKDLVQTKRDRIEIGYCPSCRRMCSSAARSWNSSSYGVMAELWSA